MSIPLTSRSLQRYLNAYLPPLAWASVIFMLSAQSILPGLEVTWVDFILKKVSHMFVFAVLYLLIVRAITLTSQPTLKPYHWKLLILPVVICLLYAISDEIHQSFIPNRYGTLRDIGYDMLGVSVVFLRRYGFV